MIAAVQFFVNQKSVLLTQIFEMPRTGIEPVTPRFSVSALGGLDYLIPHTFIQRCGGRALPPTPLFKGVGVLPFRIVSTPAPTPLFKGVGDWFGILPDIVRTFPEFTRFATDVTVGGAENFSRVLYQLSYLGRLRACSTRTQSALNQLVAYLASHLGNVTPRATLFQTLRETFSRTAYVRGRCASRFLCSSAPRP